MKKLLFFMLSSFLSICAFAQDQGEITSWKFEARKISANKYEIKFIASILSPWHIYSTTQAEGGPTPTKFTFTKSPLIRLEGGIKEKGEMEEHFEPVFELNTKFYQHKVEFIQLVNVKAGVKTNLAGTIEFMTCTNESCRPAKTIPFNVTLN